MRKSFYVTLRINANKALTEKQVRGWIKSKMRLYVGDSEIEEVKIGDVIEDNKQLGVESGIEPKGKMP